MQYKCRNCREIISVDAKFCPHCSYELTQSEKITIIEKEVIPNDSQTLLKNISNFKRAAIALKMTNQEYFSYWLGCECKEPVIREAGKRLIIKNSEK